MDESKPVYSASKLGEYTVTGDIAEGTFGKVKNQNTRSTGGRVHADTTASAYYQAIRGYIHPTDIIIVLEYAGGELFNYIVANGRMPEARARRFFQQIISGIEYSHKLKIVHRDLKPENVLLDDDLNVKIADFGLSNEIKDGFPEDELWSPNYAAPEVIRGGLYTGPEIDVWSCGVILYVMLCGRLPFEDEDVQTLFTKISQGSYHIPSYLSPDARGLINSMLAVDPVKRITVPEITQHPFYTTDLPRYLTPLPPPPGPALDFEIIEGLGDIWECLRRDDGPQGNAVKVAYMLLRDKHRLGRDLASFEEQERDAKLAAMDRSPRNTMSPAALSPATDLEDNPFEAEFNGDSDDDDRDDGLDFSTPSVNGECNNFAVLNSSLPLPDQLPEQHHLASYANAKRTWPVKEKKQHRAKWHFGIRSRSPPMEVMLEIYRTLKTLAKPGGLGGVRRQRSGTNGVKIERATQFDGNAPVDLRAASSVYFVETRARVQDVVVLMNLQLYMVDSINYLVDFHHKKTYKASAESGAGKFDMANPDTVIPDSSSDGRSIKDKDPLAIKEDEVVSPFVFMDVACRLILELAGGGE
ncbi:kinase-like domain-containing protein [Pisolithus tinctorius]|nr:kinase-like domain-containing protein [Pisolithus tinctorius]